MRVAVNCTRPYAGEHQRCELQIRRSNRTSSKPFRSAVAVPRKESTSPRGAPAAGESTSPAGSRQYADQYAHRPCQHHQQVGQRCQRCVEPQGNHDCKPDIQSVRVSDKKESSSRRNPVRGGFGLGTIRPTRRERLRTWYWRSYRWREWRSDRQ